MASQATPTKQAWTPGPWELHYSLSDGAFSVIENVGDFVIAQRNRHQLRSEECQANAKLIAKAPEMAEALKECMELIDSLQRGIIWSRQHQDVTAAKVHAERILREAGAL